MDISIIIPYYNAKEYTDELLDTLAPQIKRGIECCLVDDGSKKPYKTKYKWCKVIRKENGGCASARNVGIENTTGKYIAFIDADDLVPEYFVEKLLQKIEETGADVIDYSWKSLSKEGTQHDKRLRSDSDRLPNPSVCTRAFKRSFIGDVRFNERKDSTEDEDFSRKIGYLNPDNNFNHASITDYMYYYRTAVTNSKVKRFKQGIMNTKRIVYYYNHVTKDMTFLLDEIRKEDELNEVWLLTNQCDIPELKRYCQISKPMGIWTHYQRGEPYNRCTIITPPINVDIVIYCEFANKVGGILTSVYNFCQNMKNDYKILFLYDNIEEFQVRRFKEIVQTMKNDKVSKITCKTLMLNRLTDKIPLNVEFEKSIQICHACVQSRYKVPNDRDFLVNVSKFSKDSWGDACEKGIVINNMTYKRSKKELLLVAATRIGARDKGKNDERYIKLANMLNEAGIGFRWLIFSDIPLPERIKNVYHMGITMNVQDYIRNADYLVQLSDKEAYCMSILEALTNNTPVICTPVESFYEEGVKDGINAHVIPFDMDFDVHKLLDIPKFDFKYDNQSRIDQWKNLIDKPFKAEREKVQVIKPYFDIKKQNHMSIGDVFITDKQRAIELAELNLIKIL